MKKDFEGKYAIVTGGTSGMGASSAMMMAERGLSGLVIIGRNEERGAAVAGKCKEYGCDAHFFHCDVSCPKDVEAAVAYALSVMPKIDILMNAAGVSPYDDPWNVETLEHWDMIINTNLRSQFLFCTAVCKHMVENGYGRIVNYASCVARTGSGISLSYAASKGGIVSMTRSLAKVVGKLGVNVNAVLPGVIDTPMCAGHDYSEAAKAWPLGRMGQAEEVAEVAVFLASDRASYITGASVDANGGYVFS